MIERIWEGSGHGLIKELSQHVPGGTEDNHEYSVRIAGVLAEI
jgi:hypothetical protein